MSAQEKSVKTKIMFIAIGVIAFVGGSAVGYILPHSMMGNDAGSGISMSAIGDVEARALAGSVPDSSALIRRFDRCASGTTSFQGLSERQCAQARDFWMQVDAENGNTLGASMLYNIYVSSNLCGHVKRAGFWARKIGGTNLEARKNEVNQEEHRWCQRHK